MDFVFDCTADGTVLKPLVIVDDATHECVSIVTERSMGGNQLTRVLDEVAPGEESLPLFEAITVRSSSVRRCSTGHSKPESP